MSIATLRPPKTRELVVFRRAIIEGVPRLELALEHKLQVSTIDRYIRLVERWTTMQVIELETIQVGAIHVRRLEHQWSELMAAWNRSKEGQLITKVSKDKDGNERVEQTRKSSPGDFRILEQARRVQAEILELLGIQQIITQENLPDHVDSLSLEQRMAIVDRLFAEVHHASADEPAVRADCGRTDDRLSPEHGGPSHAAAIAPELLPAPTVAEASGVS